MTGIALSLQTIHACCAVSIRKSLTLYRYVLSLFQDLTHTFAYEDFVHWDEDEEGMAFYFQYSRPGKKPRSVRIMSPFVSISVLACSARSATDLMLSPPQRLFNPQKPALKQSNSNKPLNTLENTSAGGTLFKSRFLRVN